MLGQDIGGGLTVTKNVGSGSFSVGYKAEGEGQEPVFVKVPKERKFHEPFIAVIEAYSSLKGSHPSVARFIDAKMIGKDLPAIVTEFCDYPSARKRVNAGARYSVTETVDIANRLLDGLEYLHAQDRMHSDVSPDNIKISDQGAAKLTDLFHDVFIGFFSGEKNPAGKYAVYNNRQGEMKHLWFNREISPTILLDREMDKPNPYTDLFMLSSTLNVLMTGRAGNRLYDGNGDDGVIKRMQYLIDKGRADLKLEDFSDLGSLQPYERGFHSVKEMREELRKVIGIDYSRMEAILAELRNTLGDGRKLAIKPVEEVYSQLLAFPSDDQRVGEYIKKARETITDTIGAGIYRAFEAAQADILKRVTAGKMKEAEFWTWHKERTSILGVCLRSIMRSDLFDSILEGYRGPTGKGEPLYVRNRDEGKA